MTYNITKYLISYNITKAIGILYIFGLLFFVTGKCYGNGNFSEETERLYLPHSINYTPHDGEENWQSIRMLSLRDDVESNIANGLTKASALLAGFSASFFYMSYTNQDGLEIALNSMPIICGILGGVLLGEVGSYFVRKAYR